MMDSELKLVIWLAVLTILGTMIVWYILTH